MPFSAGRSDQKRVQACTSTTDGTGAGQIRRSAAVVKVTSGNANRIITLPAAKIGHEILILANDTGYELRATGSGVKINNVEVVDADKELAVAAAKTVHCVCVSATEWIVTKFSNAGASAGAGTPN